MSNKLNVILKTNGDESTLLLWLDYHKHIFDSGIVVIQNDQSGPNIKTQIRRILSGSGSEFENDERLNDKWQIIETQSYPISSSRYSENGFDLLLTPYEFLLDTNKANIIEHCKHHELYKINYQLREDDVTLPNNIVDFLLYLQQLTENTLDTFSVNRISLLTTYNNASSSHQFEIKSIIDTRIEEVKRSDYIYYLDAYTYSDYTWGEDRVILSEDANLLDRTDFNVDGHNIFAMDECNTFLKQFVELKIREATSQQIDAAKYHLHITDEDHTKIINAMPYKKTESDELHRFATYIETRVSEILRRRVRIFNDDIWIRICRPSALNTSDYNPCHRDIYLDFYRNIVNIYVPIVGSNDKSSLAMQSGSHLWNEHDVVVTRGGAYFKHSGKKYSVDAILKSRQPLNMTRPNPASNEFILFSPYLIHGCSSNENEDMTRMSIEIRFIEDNENAKIQEDEFNVFLDKRNWR
jgi:ectoine hydroxylase-related dioxygenase (phytanoyl-CoA dioxygenase family)